MFAANTLYDFLDCNHWYERWLIIYRLSSCFSQTCIASCFHLWMYVGKFHCCYYLNSLEHVFWFSPILTDIAWDMTWCHCKWTRYTRSSLQNTCWNCALCTVHFKYLTHTTLENTRTFTPLMKLSLIRPFDHQHICPKTIETCISNPHNPHSSANIFRPMSETCRNGSCQWIYPELAILLPFPF